jgi:hypothetical protein
MRQVDGFLRTPRKRTWVIQINSIDLFNIAEHIIITKPEIEKHNTNTKQVKGTEMQEL